MGLPRQEPRSLKPKGISSSVKACAKTTSPPDHCNSTFVNMRAQLSVSVSEPSRRRLRKRTNRLASGCLIPFKIACLRQAVSAWPCPSQPPSRPTTLLCPIGPSQGGAEDGCQHARGGLDNPHGRNRYQACNMITCGDLVHVLGDPGLPQVPSHLSRKA